MATSNPALLQLWLLPFAIIPGLLAYLRILSPNQAGILVISLYLVSRWHAAKIQRQFETQEALKQKELAMAAADQNKKKGSKSSKKSQ